MQFHQDEEAKVNSPVANRFPYATPWVLRDLGNSIPNLDICGGANAGNPRVSPPIYTERVWPLEGKTPPSGGFPAGTDGSRSYPICFVKNSTPKIVVTMGAAGYSQISNTSINSMGYPCPPYPIKLKVKQDSSELTAVDNVSNISPGSEYGFNCSGPVKNAIDFQNLNFTYEWSYVDNGTEV